jgi:hypothetical protein
MNMRNLQRLAALGCMWAVLWFLYSETTVDYAWALGCIVVIAMVLEFLAYQMGIAQGIDMYRNLTEEQRREINKIMDNAND